MAGSFSQRLKNYISHVGVDIRFERLGRNGWLIDVFIHERGKSGRRFAKRAAAVNHHLVEHNAQGIDIGAVINFAAFEMFGRHVEWGANVAVISSQIAVFFQRTGDAENR